MQFLPKKITFLKKLVLLLSCLLFTTLILVFFLLYREYLREINQEESVFNVPPVLVETDYKPPCLQQVNQDGWEIKDGKVLTYPRCLTVMNSRFGSRFNFDWYFGQQKVKSSSMGNMQDFDSNFVIQISDSEKSTQLFPLQPNSEPVKVSSSLGLTYHEINFELEDVVLTVIVRSPFAPSKSVKDENTKLSVAPFFYIDFEVENKTQNILEKTISISLGDFEKREDKRNRIMLYYLDPIDSNAQRVLTAANDKDIEADVRKFSGGIRWNILIKPQEKTGKRLVYANYTDNTALVESFNTAPKTHESNASVTVSSPNTNRHQLKFAYTNWFKNVVDVVNYAFSNQRKILRATDDFEKILSSNTSLTPQEKWLAAQAFHSYIGNTRLVYDLQQKEYGYYVWEGEFKYLNTLDVAHDYAVVEGMYFPWVLKYELESWKKAVKYDEKGAVIPHDLGIHHSVTGTEAYQIPGWQTSGMPVEENANFIILSYWYLHNTGDTVFIKELSPFLSELVLSLVNRDQNGNGIADSNIGMTTYDSDSNSALKDGPDSSYLALKQLTVYIFAEKIFALTDDTQAQELVREQTLHISNSLANVYEQYGFIPLSLDPEFVEKNQFEGKKVKGIEEQGFAYISGLYYLALTETNSPYLKELLPALSKTYPSAYEKSLVKSSQGAVVGLQLTEYQALNLGWFSHSLMADYIAEKLFTQDYNSWETFYPRIYDSPYGFTDGHYFNEPFYPPRLCLLYYPRGVTIFSFLK
ncbi:MAG: glycoside hydrolase family 52 protein [Patescibacteria group bacterium]|jgi:hypothetical protein